MWMWSIPKRSISALCDITKFWKPELCVSMHFLRSKQSVLASRARWLTWDAGYCEKTFMMGSFVHTVKSWRSHLPTFHCGKQIFTLLHLPTATSVRLNSKGKFCHYFFFLTFYFSSSWKLNSWLKTAALIVPRRFCRFLLVSPLILWSVRLSYGALKLSENMAFIKARLSCQRMQTSAVFVRHRRKWKFVIERNQ